MYTVTTPAQPGLQAALDFLIGGGHPEEEQGGLHLLGIAVYPTPIEPTLKFQVDPHHPSALINFSIRIHGGRYT